jgi:superoxide dismutase
MAFDLAPLPYGKSALEPHMSAKTLDFHHDKHHRSYVDGLNELVKDRIKDRIKEVQQLLGREAASVQTASAVPSVFDEVFVPDPPDEDDENPSHGPTS